MRISPFILSTVLLGSGVLCAAGDQVQEPVQRVSAESLSFLPRGSDDSDVPHPPPGTERPVATHRPLDPEIPDILYGSTSSLWDAGQPIEWALANINETLACRSST